MLMMNKYIGTVGEMGGIPAVLTPFHYSMKNLIQWNYEYLCAPGESVYYPEPPTVSIHDIARNAIAESFLGDWLVMLDTDHVFDPDLCYRLLNLSQKCESDVVVGFYQYKNPPHLPVLFKFIENRGLIPIVNWDRTANAIEVDSAGAGCLCVHRRVFDRIDSELQEKPFTRIEGYGEDHSFFLRLRKLGIKTVCSPNIKCNHINFHPVDINDYNPDEVEQSEKIIVKGYK